MSESSIHINYNHGTEHKNYYMHLQRKLNQSLQLMRTKHFSILVGISVYSHSPKKE